LTIKDTFIASLVPIFLGFGFVIAKPAMDDFPPILLMGLRFTFAASILIWWFPIPKGYLIKIFIASLVANTIQYSVTYSGLNLIDASAAVLLVQTEVPFGVLFAYFMLKEKPTIRSLIGIFIAFQYPLEIPGVNTNIFLKTSLNAIRKARGEKELDAIEFLKLVKEKAKELKFDEEKLNRQLNVGFSGGEKKKNEILQMSMLAPKLSILDETDSGLDIDALKIVADGVNTLRNKDNSFLIITHYQRLLDYIKPDFVHVLMNGKIIRSGGPELAIELEKKGYESFN